MCNNNTIIREFQYFQQPEILEETKIDSINLLPDELIIEIFSYLKAH